MKTLHHSRTIPLTLRLGIHYALIQGFYWASAGVFFSFLVIFLQGRGLSTSQIGFINSFRIGVCILGQFFYAYIGDKYKQFPLKYMVTAILAVATVTSVILQVFRPGFIGMSILFIIFGLTESSASSLLDSLVLQYVNAGVPIKYSVCRSAGSITCGVLCFVLGPLIDLFGSEFIVILHTITLALTVVSVLTFRTFHYATEMPKELQASSAKGSGSVLALLRDHKQYRWLLISNVLLCFGYWPISGFLPNIIEAVGGTDTMFGIALFVGAMSEMFMLAFLFPILSKKVAIEKLLFCSAVFTLVRWGSLAILQNPWAMVAMQLTQMVSYGLSMPAAVQYINASIPEENRIKGQTFYNISGSVGGTIGNSMFGVILERTNTTTMTSVGAGFIFASILCMGYMLLCGRKTKKT